MKSKATAVLAVTLFVLAAWFTFSQLQTQAWPFTPVLDAVAQEVEVESKPISAYLDEAYRAIRGDETDVPADEVAVEPEEEVATADALEDEASMPAVDEMAPPPPYPVDPASAIDPPPMGDSDSSELIELDTERALDGGIDLIGGDEDGEDLISITLDDVPLQDVVRMFTRISGANIVAGTNLTGSVTVSLQDVEWEPAFRTILDSADMVLVEKTPGIYTIMSRNDLADEPVTVDTVFLKFTTVSNVLPVVNRMLISTNASVSPFPSANAIVVQETVERLNTIREVIKQIDKPRPQVYIEAKFVELNDSAISDIGIDWSPLGSDESGLGYTIGASGLQRDYIETKRKFEQDAVANFDVMDTRSGFGDTLFRDDISGFRDEDGVLPEENRRTRNRRNNNSRDNSELDVAIDGRNFENIQINDEGGVQVETILPMERVEVVTSLLTAEDFELTLSALEQTDGVEIISNPKVIVANEEKAMIHVGRNEPNVVAVPQGDTGDRFAFTLDSRMPFIEIGVKLEVTPTVNTEENITVKLVPELSRLIGQKEVGEGSTRITFPITQIRRIVTQFNLESGNTVAIGGLTETRDQENITKIPILGDLPLLGKYLFRHTHTETVQDEVIIFVTVGLANPKDLQEVAGIPSEGLLIHKYLARRAAQSEADIDEAVDFKTDVW